MKIKTTGKSIKELLAEYGTGSNGLYPQEWYKKEAFFTEKPEAGEWDIDFGTDLTNMTYSEQMNKVPNGYDPIHPAILIEAILLHYKETGQKMLSNSWSRTSILDSDGFRVSVGGFGAEGLDVSRWSDDSRVDSFGLSAARKLSSNPGTLEPLESLSLESRIKSLEEDMEKIRKFLIT